VKPSDRSALRACWPADLIELAGRLDRWPSMVRQLSGDRTPVLHPAQGRWVELLRAIGGERALPRDCRQHLTADIAPAGWAAADAEASRRGRPPRSGRNVPAAR
jgi:hypothetical protein